MVVRQLGRHAAQFERRLAMPLQRDVSTAAGWSPMLSGAEECHDRSSHTCDALRLIAEADARACLAVQAPAAPRCDGDRSAGIFDANAQKKASVRSFGRAAGQIRRLSLKWQKGYRTL
jgi:hypothetical protein